MPSSIRWLNTVYLNVEVRTRGTTPVNSAVRALGRGKTFLLLPVRQKVALGRVLIALAVVEVGLRFVAADRLAALVGSPLLLSEGAAAPPALTNGIFGRRAEEIRMLLWVLPHWRFRWATPCLREALVSGVLLRHQLPHLRLGVATENGEIFAHAWVEVSGHSLWAEPGFTALGHRIDGVR